MHITYPELLALPVLHHVQRVLAHQLALVALIHITYPERLVQPVLRRVSRVQQQLHA